MNFSGNTNAWLNRTGLAAVCVMAVSMTVSRALFNLAALLLVVSWVFSGRFRNLVSEARQSPMVLLCILLYAWIVIGLTYSSAPTPMAWDQVASYSKLLIIPVMASFVTTPQHARALWTSVAVGLLLLQVSYLSDLWIDIPGTHSVRTQSIGVFNNYIVEGLSLTIWALVMVAASALLLNQRNWKLAAALALAGLAFYTVMFLNPGRGAQLAMIASLSLLTVLLLPAKIRWIGLGCVCLVIGSLAFQSTLVKQRLQQAVTEVKSSETNKATSVGSRINAWRAGLEIWSSSPIVGKGAGSYKHLMHEQQSVMVGGCQNNPVCLQPHSQYVLFMAEQGMVGLMLFMALLGSLVWPAISSTHISAKLSAAFACAFAVHSAFDSGLRMGTQMFVFMVLAVALAAATRIKWPCLNEANSSSL